MMKRVKLQFLAVFVFILACLAVSVTAQTNGGGELDPPSGHWKWQYYPGDYGGACFPEAVNCYVIDDE
jgi:hypothetical protein